MNATEVLGNIARQVEQCEKCELHFSRNKSVPGEGPATATFMFVGEGPGFYENEQGRPFVGASGKFLDELLQMAGLKRSEVFICNVVKCRPPSNRDPLPEELAACRPYLEEQIAAINPQVVVTLGRFSMAHFLPSAKISYIHGRPNWVNGRLIIPMYHPAAALHQPALKDSIVGDFRNLPSILAKGLAEKDPRESVSKTAAPVPAQPALELTQPKAPSFTVEPADDKADDADKPVQLSLF